MLARPQQAMHSNCIGSTDGNETGSLISGKMGFSTIGGMYLFLMPFPHRKSISALEEGLYLL